MLRLYIGFSMLRLYIGFWHARSLHWFLGKHDIFI